MLVQPHEAAQGYTEALAYMPHHLSYQPQDEYQGEVGAGAFSLPPPSAGLDAIQFPIVRSNTAVRDMAAMEAEYEGFAPPPGTLPLASKPEVNRLKVRYETINYGTIHTHMRDTLTQQFPDLRLYNLFCV